jgi:putative transposase
LCQPERFNRWCETGVLEPMFWALIADRNNQYQMIDSMIVRA